MISQPCAAAKHTVRTYQPWAEVLGYLQQHVGDLLHCKPIVFWHGEGWHMEYNEVEPRGRPSRMFYDVTFDDPKQEVAFALKWT